MLCGSITCVMVILEASKCMVFEKLQLLATNEAKHSKARVVFLVVETHALLAK